MHMRTTAAVLTIAVAGSAQAGIQISPNTNDLTGLIGDYAALRAGGDTSLIRVNGLAGFTAGSQLSFGPGVSNPLFAENGSFNVDVAIPSQGSGSFILDTLGNAGLGNNWFDAGQTPRPSDDTVVLAFGNEGATSAREVVLAFNPGVTAFGFNFEDVGDFGGQLVVNWTNGTQTVVDPAQFTADGFISIVSDDGTTIDDIKISNSADSDGFVFYGFTSVQAVPLPPAALGGLAMLGGLGIARRLRKS